MGLFETFLLALKNISASKMRTFLTMLGIIIGVTAVIVIMSLGDSMQRYLAESFSRMGTRNLTVYVWGGGRGGDIEPKDMYDLVARYPDLLKMATPSVYVTGNVRIGKKNYSRTDTDGVSEQYFDIDEKYRIVQGRALEYLDMRDRKAVCVIGMYLARDGFTGNPIGQELKIGTDKYTVVGVVGQMSDDVRAGSEDDFLVVPYTTALRSSRESRVSQYKVRTASEDVVTEAREVLQEELLALTGSADSFYIYSMGEMLATMTASVSMVVVVLGIIAGISLVVGGIGIMNIMLVSVTERTREIGIRKALGAKESSILVQFVIEAAVTSALGGILGILLGSGIAVAASPIISHMIADDDVAFTVIPSVRSMLLAFGISSGIGVLFGYLPARKAARLNPIDALRYD